MRSILFCLAVAIFCPAACFAQTVTAPAASSDTTIYDIVDQAPIPLISSCLKNQPANWTIDSLKKCADAGLLAILTSNVRYPEEARKKNTQGMVVLTFIVETTGKVSNISLLKDIGNGCGAEAIRVMKGLDDAGLHYKPGQKNNKPVRVRQTLPVRFKLEEALPYYINAAHDTIYTVLNTGPMFKGGLDSLARYTVNQLQYPTGKDTSCRTGIIEMSLLIRADGAVKIDNQIDFSNLGLDYQWEAIRLANRTIGMWTPAMYQGRAVTTTQPLRVVFQSDFPTCKFMNTQFEKAVVLANEGAELLDKKQTEAAIEKFSQALTLHPDNTEWMYYRGTAYLNLNRREDACKDFSRVKEILGITWFENMRKLLCGY
jgi:TonB family protein